MDGEFAAQLVATLGSLNGIDIANQVSDRNVGHCQLLDVTLVRQ